jgi:hypothetical protein
MSDLEFGSEFDLKGKSGIVLVEWYLGCAWFYPTRFDMAS